MSDADIDPLESWPSLVRRILVVDRDESVAASVKQLVATIPCTVDCAKDDVEALALIDHEDPARSYDVILADLCYLSPSDSALRPLIETAGQRLPIIITFELGYDRAVSLVKMRGMGLRQFIYKPFRPKYFYDAVGQVVHKSQS